MFEHSWYGKDRDGLDLPAYLRGGPGDSSMLSLVLYVTPVSAGAEGCLISDINAERTSRGKPALQVYWDLTDDASARANRMRDQQSVFHHPDLASVTDGWYALAENVAAGGSIDGVMAAFMGSSSHRANILNSQFNYVGAGVKEDSTGILWVSVIFMAGPDGLVDPPSTTTTTTTTTQPPSITTTTQPPSTTTTTQPPSTTTTTQPPTTTTTTQPPSTTTTTQPPTTTTTTQPPSTTTTTQPPGSTTTTTTTVPPGDDGDPDGTGPPGTVILGTPTGVLRYDEFAVLSPHWLNPSLLRLIGLMGR